MWPLVSHVFLYRARASLATLPPPAVVCKVRTCNLQWGRLVWQVMCWCAVRGSVWRHFFVWVVVSFLFYFHPYLGKFPILINIFRRGWNHQLVVNYQQSIAKLMFGIRYQNNFVREWHQQYNWCCCVCEHCCQRAASRELAEPTEYSKKWAARPLILAAKPALETTLGESNISRLLKLHCNSEVHLWDGKSKGDMLLFSTPFMMKVENYDAYHFHAWIHEMDNLMEKNIHLEDLPQQVLLPEERCLQSKRARWSVQRKEGRATLMTSLQDKWFGMSNNASHTIV